MSCVKLSSILADLSGAIGVQDAQFGLTHGRHAVVQGSAKERFNEIQQELSQLSTKFSNNLLDATKAFKKLLKDPAEVQLSVGFYSLWFCTSPPTRHYKDELHGLCTQTSADPFSNGMLVG